MSQRYKLQAAVDRINVHCLIKPPPKGTPAADMKLILDDWPHREQEVERLRADLAAAVGERTAALAAVDSVDLCDVDQRDNADPDQLRQKLYGAGLKLAAAVGELERCKAALREVCPDCKTPEQSGTRNGYTCPKHFEAINGEPMPAAALRPAGDQAKGGG